MKSIRQRGPTLGPGRSSFRYLAYCALLASLLSGQTPNQTPAATGDTREEGIPITDPLVIAKCGSCHTRDDRGNMQRISWARTTPEGWQNVLRRMILSHDVMVSPPEARSIVKYLSTYHGLAPEEAKPIMYDAERRVYEETNIPTLSLRNACASCHAFALPLSWRRSSGDWKQFVDSHVARHTFPLNQEAVEFLASAAPLHTPEWDAWSTRTATPGLAGRWLVTASIPARGKYWGDIRLEPSGDDEFTSRVNLTSVRDGSTIVRTGRIAVYGGYAWRGRSSGEGPKGSAPDNLSSEAREVLWIAGDHSKAAGRWFWGQYQEFGFNVELQRASSDPTLLVIDQSSLKLGSRTNRIRIIGENLPDPAPADLDFGPGVVVRRIVSHTRVEIVAEVDVSADAPMGARNLVFRGSTLPGSLAIYDRVDYIKVTPESAVAAFADPTHSKGYLPFDAIGYQRGADGRSHTADDVMLGPVDVTWSVQVFHAPEGSNSDFVGRMNGFGLFAPASENPNNNFDCWVTATAREVMDQNGQPLVGKSYLVVTVPTYTFNGREYVRELGRWVDNGPASGEH
jgi:quinohemoprotein amine dehydrogenase